MTQNISCIVYMIEITGCHNALTITQIVNLQGITKGAVSQTTSKLTKKILLKKSYLSMETMKC